MFASGIKSRKKCLLVGGDAKAELLDYFMYVVFVEMYGMRKTRKLAVAVSSRHAS